MREIKSQVVEYLRKVQVLNGNPEVINLPENFQNILQNIPIATNQTMQQKAMQEISNSNDETIIMIASGWGHRGVGYLAANKPNTKGLLISSPRIEKRFPDFLFRHIPNLENYLVFQRGQDEIQLDNIALSTNRLYRANGIQNVEYIEREIVEEHTKTLPKELREITTSNKSFITYEAPVDLAWIIGKIHNKIGGTYFCVSPSAPERLGEESFVWDIVQESLGLSNEETQGYAQSTNKNLQDRFNYDIIQEKKIGTMIKLGLAISLADLVGGKVYRNLNKAQNTLGYNFPDFFVCTS